MANAFSAKTKTEKEKALRSALEAALKPDGEYRLVPTKATREIENAIGRARNLSASEIWEDALSAAPPAQPDALKPGAV